jgi:hypothetical protein
MMCECTGLNHGEGMYFALPKVPDSMTFEHRLKRWTTLVSMHPMLNQFDAKRFLNDQGPDCYAMIQRTRPIMTRLMGEYKESDALTKSSWIPKVGTNDFIDQVKRDCDLVLNLFYRGDWGQIKVLEWIMLQNAVHTCSNPEDFAGQESLDMRKFMDVTMGISDLFSMFELRRGNGLNFQMEDILIAELVSISKT